MIVHEQKYLVILLSLMDLNGGGTKAQVLDNILEKDYLKLSALDCEIMSSRDEMRWRNDLAYKRNELKDKGFVDGSRRNWWDITDAGISYLKSLAKQACTQMQWEKLTSNAVIRARSEINDSDATSHKNDVKSHKDTKNSEKDLSIATNLFLNESYEDYISKNVDEIEKIVIAIEEICNTDQIFEPSNIQDARERAIGSIVRRRGQPVFRSQLLRLYQGRCAITGENVEQALEAAHIIAYKGENTNHPQNGLLLRADIHTLFDLRLIAIDSKTMTVLVSSALIKTSYGCFIGKRINLPVNKQNWPSATALDIHRREAGL